jgi:hypothetical protein
MPDQPAPIVLELAPLPREQIGPFLLLGVPKDADREQIEAAWAERVKVSRRNLIRVPLEDINWAREVINDPDRRYRAASATINLDTGDSILQELARACGLGETPTPTPTWKPYDSEKALADWTPAVPVPDPLSIAQTIAVPEVPLELPAVAMILKQFLPETLDPWALNLATDPKHE